MISRDLCLGRGTRGCRSFRFFFIVIPDPLLTSPTIATASAENIRMNYNNSNDCYFMRSCPTSVVVVVVIVGRGPGPLAQNVI